ncbi:MAG TPA: hypothetical protein VFC78_02770 [Tepidisphaeraceae bacterium]|nr:hypothetical protein [Tepidisphaeraceae bacterium]
MSDTTTRELQWIVSAKDVGAAEVFKKLGDDARFTVKQIQDAQNKVGRPLEAAQLQMAEYRKAYHETINKLRADTESTVARLTTTPAAIAARESAEAVRRSIAESRAAMAQEESSTHTGLLRSLNAKVGRGSTFSMGARALGGAGALLGVGMASHMLRDATEQANKLDQELRGGTKTAAEAADAMARQIPILGGVYSAAASINQIFGSQAREIDRINALNKVTEAATSGRLELLKREREEYKAIALQIRELSQTGARVGLGGGASGILALQQHQQNSKDDLAADIKKATDANKESVKDKMAEVHAAANATFHGSIRGTVVGAWNDMFSKVGINIPGLKGLAGAEEKESEADRGAATTEQGVLDAQRIQADAATKKELTRKQAQDAQTTARQIIEATREYNRQKYEDFRKTEDAIGQLMASNHQHELRQAGLFYSADAAALSQSVSLKKEALDREFQEHLQALQREKVAGIATQADIDRAVADARAQNHALDVQYAQSKEDLQRQTGQRMAGLASSIARAQIDAMGGASAAGDHRMDFEKARLEIAEQYNAKYRKLNELVRTADASQRKAAQDELDKLPALEKQAEAASMRNFLETEYIALKQRQAEAGDDAAAAELKQYEAAKKLREEAEKLQGIIANKNTSPQDRAIAQNNLDAIPKVAQQAAGKTLLDAQKQILGASNNPLAARALARLNAAEEFKKIDASLESVLHDPNATASQKAQAQASLKNLPGEAKNAANRAGMPKSSYKMTATYEDNTFGGNHGHAIKAREDAYNRAAAENMAIAATELRAINQKADRILNALGNSEPQRISQ